MTDPAEKVKMAILAEMARLEGESSDWSTLTDRDKFLVTSLAQAAISAHLSALTEAGMVVVPRDYKISYMPGLSDRPSG